ncbi:MAG: hypothetical protein IJB96_02415, partial [Lachnospira sp.]|nr:hypothetical protein [Lachnospira sp.]
MNNSNTSDTLVKIITIVRYTSLILIALVLSYFILAQFILPDERDEVDPYTTMNEGWTYIDATGNEKTVTIAGYGNRVQGEVVTITNTIPDNLAGINALCYHAMWQDVKIYINDELRAEYSTEDSRAFGNSSAIRFIFANIRPDDAGKEVRIETITNTTYAGHYRAVYIGDKMGIFMFLFNSSIPKATLTLSMIILCLLVILICSILMIFYKKHIPLVYLALSMFFAAFWIFSEIDLRQFVFRNVSALSNMTFWSLMFIPPPLVLFINDIQNNRHKKIHIFPLVYQVIIIILISILQIFNIADFRNTLFLMHFGIIVSIISIFASILIDI